MLKLEPISKLISQVCSLPTGVLKLPSSLLLVVLLTTGSSLAFAQNTPGSFEDLQLDFDPLQVPVLPSLEPQQGRVLPELEPLELPSASGFEIGPLPAPQLAPDREPASVLELPQLTLDDEPVPSKQALPSEQALASELTLPELTVPTPDNSRADFSAPNDLSTPDLNPQFQQRSVPATSFRPRLVAPQPLSYRQLTPYSNVGRSFQIQFYSVNRGFRYQPRGNYGYRPYGGYGGYGYRASGNCGGGRR